MARSKKLLLVAVLAVLAGAAGAAEEARKAVESRPPAVLRHLPPSPEDRHQAHVSSFVLTSPQGVRVFLDVVVVPDDLAPAFEDPRSLLVVTNKAPDHFAGAVPQRFKGGMLVSEPGVLKSGDVKVELLRSSRIDDSIDGTDDIAVVDLDGVRVVHFGDCGQSRLTPDQLARIGRVDVMIGAFEASPYSDDPLPPALAIVGQLAPTVIIPTHLMSVAALGSLAGRYRSEIAQRTEFSLTPALLEQGKRIVFLGGNVPLASDAGVPPSKDL